MQLLTFNLFLLLLISASDTLSASLGTAGPIHVCASGSQCSEGQCMQHKTLCLTFHHACGLLSCPLFAFCDQFSQQCYPDTCEHRLRYWCPYDHGSLREVPCMRSIAHTQCFASTTGMFTCSVSGSMLSATCNGRVTAAVAAVRAHSSVRLRTTALLLRRLRRWLSKVFGVTQWRDSQDHSSSRTRSWLGPLLNYRRRSSRYTDTDLPGQVAFQTGQSSISTSSLSAGRQRSLLQDSVLYTGNLDGRNYARFFPGRSPDGLDPNLPYGRGTTGQFVNGFLDSVLNSQDTAKLVSKFVGPSYGGPVPVSSIQPVMNPSGNVVQTGGNPGGAFIRAGPGGAVAGTYGGGWTGPYNTRTGTYGLGGNFGFAGPYFGDAQGTAIFAVTNASYFPGASTITYACPAGAQNGTMISVGIPCGVQMISLPASQLPTINGLPSGPQMTGLVSESIYLSKQE